MARHSKQQAKQSQARRSSALSRPELREATAPRRSPQGATSFPVKAVDDDTRRLIDAALKKRGALS